MKKGFLNSKSSCSGKSKKGGNNKKSAVAEQKKVEKVR
jgi:hypothetical protein